MTVFHAGGSEPTMGPLVLSYASVLESSVIFSLLVVPTTSIALLDLKSTCVLLETGGLFYPMWVLSTNLGNRVAFHLPPLLVVCLPFWVIRRLVGGDWWVGILGGGVRFLSAW